MRIEKVENEAQNYSDEQEVQSYAWHTDYSQMNVITVLYIGTVLQDCNAFFLTQKKGTLHIYCINWLLISYHLNRGT